MDDLRVVLFICAFMAAEFVNTGRREMSSFQGLVTGMICIAATIASACGVLNNVGAVTTGARSENSTLLIDSFSQAEGCAKHK